MVPLRETSRDFAGEVAVSSTNRLSEMRPVQTAVEDEAHPRFDTGSAIPGAEKSSCPRTFCSFMQNGQ